MNPLHHHTNAAGLRFEWHAHGALRRVEAHGVLVNLFPGNAAEGGPANLWLRLPSGGSADTVRAVPLLGPASPLVPVTTPTGFVAQGPWQGLTLSLELRLAADATLWFWHLHVANGTARAQTLDLISVQDVGLAPYGNVRLNEHYVSHYLDLAPLQHRQRGWLVAARQNMAVQGRHPWLLMGSLTRAASFATDAMQLQGLGVRAGALPQAVLHGLPGTRLQHEHALIALQSDALTLAPGASAALGFFGLVLADHPEATQAADLRHADLALARAEASPGARPAPRPLASRPAPRSLFATAPWLPSLDLGDDDVQALFPGARRHEEREGRTLLSFFRGEAAHVVLRAKELHVQRPHGHILRSGSHGVPNEAALTSTVWMSGVFHSMVTQGHVSINRFLSTARGALGQYRSTGQRVFVDTGSGWQQLGLPSAFEIEPQACRWLYRHAQGLLEVRCHAEAHAHALGLSLRVLQGAPLRVRVLHHVALGGDDGSAPVPLLLQRRGPALWLGVPPGSELAERFPEGGFTIQPEPGTEFEGVEAGDAALFDGQAAGRSDGEPFVSVQSGATTQFGLQIRGHLVPEAPLPELALELPHWALGADGRPPQPEPPNPEAQALQRLADYLPWAQHNALVHYLAPRGLEQYSGGGWGTRDVCQGPLEMLLALDRPAPVRDLLQRVFSAQDSGGDWPQWFMFFEREAQVRAGDSHGDIVFWPLVGLARYLLATGDAALLREPLPFHAARGAQPEVAPLLQHVQRALAVIQARRIPGTHLAAYGHGDWNDSLQPANPALREQMCSAWTVTLHHQTLTLLGAALAASGETGIATALQAEARHVQADFQRLLVAGGAVAGYALFPPGAARPQLLLHPQDATTGVHFSLLPMMHAVLEDMLSPEQANEHLALIRQHLLGPDGAHLFDRPLPYRGGPQQIFQRAESSAFFGREIGNMYMHAHLRYAEMLAHLGQAQAFFDALALAHPVGLHERVAAASRRQANCYYSSSDPAFADRYEAQRDYARVAAGTVALDGGWRIYSSGPGITLGLVVGSLLGLRREHGTLLLDPVLPPALNGLRSRTTVAGHEVELHYRLGAKGCGVTAVELNGAPLPFTHRPNRYRTGAAALPLQMLREKLRAGTNRLVVSTA